MQGLIYMPTLALVALLFHKGGCYGLAHVQAMTLGYILLLKGIDHSTMVIGVRAEPEDKSSSRNWGNGAWGWATTVASLEKATRDQRTHPAGYYALRSNPKVVDGQAVTVKPCQWNELDANSSAIDF